MSLRYVLIAYMTLYSLGSLLLLVLSHLLVEPEERDPLPETALDVVLFIGLLVGMIMFAFDITAPTVKYAWRFISPTLAAFAVFSNLRGRRRRLREDPDVAASRSDVVFADIMTVLLLAPSTGINLLYAFG